MLHNQKPYFKGTIIHSLYKTCLWLQVFMTSLNEGKIGNAYKMHFNGFETLIVSRYFASGFRLVADQYKNK